MTDAIKQQIEAAGGKPLKTSAKAPPRAPRPSAGVIVTTQANETPERTKTKREDDQRPARLRPACQIATHTGYTGLRFVAYDLTQTQADALVQAAQAAGVPVRNS